MLKINSCISVQMVIFSYFIGFLLFMDLERGEQLAIKLQVWKSNSWLLHEQIHHLLCVNEKKNNT